MKTKGMILCIAIMMLGLIGCEKWSSTTVTLNYYKGDVIKGLKIVCPANVVVNKVDGVGGLIIETNSNLADDIVVTRDLDGVVKVELRKHIRVPAGTKLILNIAANVNSMVKLDASSASNISFNDSELFQERECEIDISGASRVSGLNMTLTEDLNLDLSGASDFKGNIVAREYDCDLSGASHVEMGIKTCNDMEIDLSGASTFNINSTIEEESNNISVNASGASNLSIPNCKFRRGEVNLTGASFAKLWITGTLDCDLSGASELGLKGSPSIGNINTSGGSKITNWN